MAGAYAGNSTDKPKEQHAYVQLGYIWLCRTEKAHSGRLHRMQLVPSCQTDARLFMRTWLTYDHSCQHARNRCTHPAIRMAPPICYARSQAPHLPVDLSIVCRGKDGPEAQTTAKHQQHESRDEQMRPEHLHPLLMCIGVCTCTHSRSAKFTVFFITQ